MDGRRISVASGSADARIGEVTGRQRGRAARWQLLAAEVAPAAIARRLRRNRLTRIHWGVYGLPGTDELPLATETAALLACGEGALLSHHSAAVLWRLRSGVARPVHVTIAGDGGCPRLDGVLVHRSKILMPADIRILDGLPITSPARTLLDVAATLPARDVERLLDEALFVRRLLTRAELADVLVRAGGHPGRGRLERVAGAQTGSTLTDSPPEETLLGLIRSAGLPEPVTQAPMLDYRLDLYWPELRLAVEVDAYGTHGSPARFESDRRRDGRLLAEKGIVVVRLTRQAIETRPFEALAITARAIAQRQAAR